MRGATKNAILAGALVLPVGLGLTACGGASTNAARTGTTPYAQAVSQERPAPSMPPATAAGGQMWFSSATTVPASAQASAPATVVHVTIENVKTPEGSEPAYVGPTGTVGAKSLFSVKAHADVSVVVVNKDTGPHTFTSPSLGLDVTIAGGATVTFHFQAPGSGTYTWYCEAPCGPWVMSHMGYMKGEVTVVS